MGQRSTITEVLLEIRSLSGASPEARDRLLRAVYAELRRLARDVMAGERAGHTLRPTALVHEAYLRLIDADRVTWEDRAHFFGIAARTMRQILVDHARERAASKRGGNATRITMEDCLTPELPSSCDVLDLHRSLERLAELDSRSAQVVELRTFAGLTVAEVASVLGVSKRTVDGDWRFARMWLTRALSGGPA